MKFRSRSEIINKIPNKYDAVMAISNRVKMLVEVDLNLTSLPK